MATKLFIPTEGPCAGHPCDNCWTCRQGRCCRRDNPDYKLPGLGEWDGPIYGEIGTLTDDGQKVECHICGEYFHHLGHHIRIHDVTPEEYRSIFGLSRKCGLSGPEYRAKCREVNINRPGQIERMRALGKAHTQRITAEQRSAWASKERREQAKRVLTEGVRRYYSGHLSKNLLLSAEDIIAIRSISPRPSTKEQFQELAARFNVSTQTIQRVLYRKVARSLIPDVAVEPPAKRGSQKLTSAEIDAIRRRLASGERQREIASEFGVSQGTVSNIATGKSHKARMAA